MEGAAVSWAIGWGSINLVSFVANQFLSISLNETFYLFVSVPLGIAGVILVALDRHKVQQLLQGPFLPDELRHGFGLGLLLLVCGFLLFVLYKGLIIYPVHADELIYHMELPKLAWETGYLPVHPGVDLFDMATAYPDLLVTQQLWIYLGAGAFDPSLVRVLMPIYTALLVLLLFFDARRWFGLVTAGLAAATVLSLYSFTSLTVLLMDEVPVAFFGYLSVHFAIEATDRGAMWFPAGLFAGFAGLVKYDGLAAILAIGVALLAASRWKALGAEASVREKWGTTLRRAAGFFLVAVLPTVPVLARNTASFRNPVYPYFFGGTASQGIPSLLTQVNVPVVVGQIWNSEITSLLATVLTAGLLLGFLRLRRWDQGERLLLLVVVCYLPPYLAYPLLGSQIRYLAPVLPAMALFAGRQIDWWLTEASRKPRLAGIGLFVLLAAICAGIVTWAPFYGPYFQAIAAVTVGTFAVSILLLATIALAAWRVHGGRGRKALALGAVLVLLVPGVIAVANEQWDPNPFGGSPNLLPVSQDTYLTMKLGSDWKMWTWMNANLPGNATVLSFDPRTFYIDARVIDALSPEMLPVYNMTLAQAVNYTNSLGVGYVVDSPFGNTLFLNYLYVTASPIYQNLSNPRYFEPVHQEGATLLVRLVAAP